MYDIMRLSLRSDSVLLKHIESTGTKSTHYFYYYYYTFRYTHINNIQQQLIIIIIMKVFLRVLAVVLAINSQDIHGTDTSLVHGDDEKHNPVAMDNTSLLLPKNGYDIDKAERIGYLSEESINSVDPLLEDVEAQVQAPQYNKQASQGSRKLDALQDFIDRCALTSGGKGYVECNGGYAVVDGVTTDQLCADACDGYCCTGEDYYPYNYKIFANGACGLFIKDWQYPEGIVLDGFTGRGKTKDSSSPFLNTHRFLSSFTCD